MDGALMEMKTRWGSMSCLHSYVGQRHAKRSIAYVSRDVTHLPNQARPSLRPR